MNFLAFPSEKFRNIWHTGSTYVTLVGVRFSLKSKTLFFRNGKRHKFAKLEKTAFTNLTTSLVFKIRIPLNAILCEKFERFHRRKLKEILNKAIKTAKNIFLWKF